MIFRARKIGNEPILVIEGTDIDHILRSRFFNIYNDGEFKVVADPSLTHIKLVKIGDEDDRGVNIGWLEEKTIVIGD